MMKYSNSITFMQAKEYDKPAILSLYRAAIGTPGSTWTYDYPNEDILEGDYTRGDLFCLKNEKDEVIGAISIDKDAIVDGFSCWTKELAPGAELARLAVREDYQNQGLARVLLNEVMEVAKERGYKSVHFLVSKTNYKALNSYAKLNFSNVGESDVYDANWWCYEKEL